MRQRIIYLMTLFAVTLVWVLCSGHVTAWGSGNETGAALALDNAAVCQVHGMTGCPPLKLAGSTACTTSGSTNCNGGITTNGCPGTCMTPCGADNSATNSGNGYTTNGYIGTPACTTTYAVNNCVPGTITGPDGQGGTADYPTCNCNGSAIGNALPCAGTYNSETGC